MCRSLSESDGESASSAKPKGILKYPKGWKKRTLSECSFEGLHSLTDDADDPDDKDASCGDLSEPESVGKSTKKVTFNQKVFKSVFKKNSLIGSLKKPRKDSKVKEARKKAGQVDLKVTENGEENDRNVTNSMTTEGSVKESHQKDSKQSLEMITKPEQVLTVDKDSVDSIEANNADNEWEEVRSKKSRSRRKRTDSRSSDHSECEDNGITEKPMCMLKEIRMHAVPQIEVK